MNRFFATFSSCRSTFWTVFQKQIRSFCSMFRTVFFRFYCFVQRFEPIISQIFSSFRSTRRTYFRNFSAHYVQRFNRFFRNCSGRSVQRFGPIFRSFSARSVQCFGPISAQVFCSFRSTFWSDFRRNIAENRRDLGPLLL